MRRRRTARGPPATAPAPSPSSRASTSAITIATGKTTPPLGSPRTVRRRTPRHPQSHRAAGAGRLERSARSTHDAQKRHVGHESDAEKRKNRIDGEGRRWRASCHAARPQLPQQQIESPTGRNAASQVESRSAVKEKPRGRQQSAPQRTCTTFTFPNNRASQVAVRQEALDRPGVDPVVDERSVLKRADDRLQTGRRGRRSPDSRARVRPAVGVASMVQ